MIEAKGLGYAYGRRTVVRDVDLHAREGRVLGLVGPNGSGKTTVLRMLHGGLTPASGEVLVDGVPLAGMKPRERTRSLAVVVQESAGESSLTAADVVLLGRTARLTGFQRAGADDLRFAEDAMRRVGALDLADRPFAALSGGEKQRVLIARAVAQDTRCVLLDEPTNHLDIRYQHEVLALLRSLGLTVVVVLHDLNLAARYCDDLVLLDHGAVVRSGGAEEVLDPEVVREVYGIGVRRLDDRGGIHLLFHLEEKNDD